MAAAVENSAWIDDHAGECTSPVTTPLASISTRPLAKITPSNRPAITTRFPSICPFDSRAFAENDCLLGNNVPSNVSVDAKSAFELKRALHGNTLVNKTRPLFGVAVFRLLQATSKP